MAKSKQAAGNKQGGSNKSAGGAGKSTNPASNTAGTGNAQAAKSQSESTQSESTTSAAVAGLPQLETPEAAGQSAVDALKQDHRRVEGLFAEFETATERQRKQELV
ncbi:hypothetical protein SAMN02990966_00713, partial [Rhodospirillales bacterium URHD0017]